MTYNAFKTMIIEQKLVTSEQLEEFERGGQIGFYSLYCPPSKVKMIEGGL